MGVIRRRSRTMIAAFVALAAVGLVWPTACSADAAATARFVVDARVNVGENDIARCQELLSGVGLGDYDVQSWKTQRIKELGIRRVQIINAFNDCARRVDGKIEYDWSTPRRLAEAVIKAGAEPKFVISCAMPRALSSRPDDAHPMSYPPASWDEYEDFIYQAVRYFNVTLAYRGCKVIYWDVQNEPEATGYWFPEEPIGSKVRYDNVLKLYQHTVKAVEKYEHDFPTAPHVKIGGLRFAGNTFFVYGDFNWVEKFLADCAATKTRLDFLSFHFYGAAASFDGHSNWSSFPSFQSKAAMIRQWMRRYAPKTELHLTEWGASEVNHTGSSGIVNGNQASGSFTAAFTKAMLDARIDKAFFLSLEDRVNPPSSGLEKNVWEMEALCTWDGVTKAIANTFRMYHMMAKDRVMVSGKDRDVDMIASREPNRITLIVWNSNLYGPDAETASAKDVKIEVQGVPGWKQVTCRRFLIDETHSNAYYYKADRAQMEAHQGLEEIEPLKVSSGGPNIDADVVRLPVQTLKPESVMLLELREAL